MCFCRIPAALRLLSYVLCLPPDCAGCCLCIGGHLTAIGWLFVSNPPVNALGNREHFFTIIVFFYQVLSPRHKEKLLNRKTNTWPLEVDKSEVPERQGLSITLSFLIKTGRPGYRNRNLKKSLQSLSLTIFKHK